MDKKILNELKQARISAGISARKLARDSGLSVTSICNIENGDTPSMKSLAKIITALSLHINTKLFLEALKAKRESLDVSLEKMAQIAGISHTILYKTIQGTMPSTKTCCIIAKKLDINLEFLH